MAHSNNVVVNAGNQDTTNANEEHENVEDYLLNREMVPYVVGKFLSCDVVMDEDQILEQAMAGNQFDNFDDLEIFDNEAVTEEVNIEIEADVPLDSVGT